MGREFIPIFSEWAEEYDETVKGKDEEYREVFLHYSELLADIAEKAGDSVIEFGSGTGNLTLELIRRNKKVFAVEPSAAMRQVAEAKPELAQVTFVDGDMERFPQSDFPIDTIVSSYVFHHLNETEKQRVIKKYRALLPEGGKVILGDTMFLSANHKESILRQAVKANHLRLAADLQREYYPLIPDIEAYFRANGFSIRSKQINAFVWLVEARGEKE
jgi:putative AdoMet-dependent methyltransferase